MDPNLLIIKTLTENNCCSKNNLLLPKDKVENIVRNTGVPIPQMDIQVEILDNTNSYWAFLKRSIEKGAFLTISLNLKQNPNGYFIGRGWGDLKNARNLKADDVIKLYWQNTKFIFSM
ncbi:unnamed protein product [Arabidopsis halleri]